MIPLIDLKRQQSDVAAEILEAWNEVLRNAAFVGGPNVEGFERDWAAFCGTRDAVGVGSGTDALRVMLIAGGVGPGDDVITVPFTFAATLEAIIQAGARPVLVDIDPEYGNLDPGLLEKAITPRTTAVLPVHLYGHPADMDPIADIAGRHGLEVYEDAAQAHGASYKGRRAGSLAKAASFSFYPAKNLGACGEAGAVTTDDPGLAVRIRALRDHGQLEKNLHEMQGFNGRLDALQAAALRVKLSRLEQWNHSRRRAASIYAEELRGVAGLALPVEAEWAKTSWHLYVVRSPRRDELREQLARTGIGTGLHYPQPAHFQKSFAFLGYKAGDFPVAERWAREVISLPMFPELEPEQVRVVCSEVKSILRS